VDTGLGDQLEAKLASMVVDATIDLVLAEADFLKPPAERLAALEQKVADVKAEMGLLRLLGYRLRTHARLVLLASAAAAAAVFLGPWAPAVRVSCARLGSRLVAAGVWFGARVPAALAAVGDAARWVGARVAGLPALIRALEERGRGRLDAFF
jgi:hypothetical protein